MWTQLLLRGVVFCSDEGKQRIDICMSRYRKKQKSMCDENVGVHGKDASKDIIAIQSSYSLSTLKVQLPASAFAILC